MTKRLTDEDLRNMVRPAAEVVPVGSQWRHEKSGGEYTVEGVALSEGGQEPVVIYRANREGATSWVRVARDFMDGRFVRLPDLEHGYLDMRARAEAAEAERDHYKAALMQLVGGTVYTTIDGFSKPHETEASRVARAALTDAQEPDQ